MVSRQINIEFPRQLIQRYNESRYNLCFSIGVGESPAFNVIAKAESRYIVVRLVPRSD